MKRGRFKGLTMTLRDEVMQRDELRRLRADPEPTRLALAMAVGIRQHLEDVLEDDAGDDDERMLPMTRGALEDCKRLVRSLSEMLTTRRA